jgi:hypothetical protein
VILVGIKSQFGQHFGLLSQAILKVLRFQKPIPLFNCSTVLFSRLVNDSKIHFSLKFTLLLFLTTLVVVLLNYLVN